MIQRQVGNRYPECIPFPKNSSVLFFHHIQYHKSGLFPEDSPPVLVDLTTGRFSKVKIDCFKMEKQTNKQTNLFAIISDVSWDEKSSWCKSNFDVWTKAISQSRQKSHKHIVVQERNPYTASKFAGFNMVETKISIMEARLSASEMSPGEYRRFYRLKIQIVKIDDENSLGKLQQFLIIFQQL